MISLRQPNQGYLPRIDKGRNMLSTRWRHVSRMCSVSSQVATLVATLLLAWGCGKEVTSDRTVGEAGESEADHVRLAGSGTATSLDTRLITVEIKEGITESRRCLRWQGTISGSDRAKRFQDVQFKGFEGNNPRAVDYGTVTGLNTIQFSVETSVAKDKIEFLAAKDDVITISGSVDNNCRSRKDKTAVVSETVSIRYAVGAIIAMPRDTDFMNKDGRITLLGAGAAVPAVIPYPDAAKIAAAPTLATTGLYSDVKTNTLLSSARPYEPRYPLWSDGTSKRRALFLPPGKQINTSNPNRWIFPVGTVAVKDFSFGGRRLETRVLVKTADAVADRQEQWTARAFAWNEEQTDAVVNPEGAVIDQVLDDGASYGIPSESQCATCHAGSESYLIGVSGLQLAGANVADPSLFDLKKLGAAGLFTDALDQQRFEFATSTGSRAALDTKALGYLHGNCGHCHNASAGAAAKHLTLRLRHEASVATLAQEPAIVSTFVSSISPGSPSNSRLLRKMQNGSMPPLGVSTSDTVGIALLSEWISKLGPMPAP